LQKEQFVERDSAFLSTRAERLKRTNQRSHKMSVKSRFLLLVLAITVIGLVAGCGSPDKKTLIEVNDWSMDVGTFDDIILTEIGGKNQPNIIDMVINNRINSIIDQRLLTDAAYDIKLDTMAYAQQRYNAELEKRASQALFTRMVLDKVITDKMLRDFYKKDAYEIRGAHILIKVTPERPNGLAKALADSLYEVAIQPDIDFHELAEQYNEDTSTPRGDIGWFSWGMMVDEFQDAAFSLPVGSISKPIKTVYGWHILKVVDKKEKLKRLPYERDRNRIREVLMKRHGVEIAEQSNKYTQEVFKRYDVKLDTTNMFDMVDQINNPPQRNISPDPWKFVSEEDRQKALATFSVEPYKFTVDDLAKFVNAMVHPNQRRLTKETVQLKVSTILGQSFLLPVEAKRLKLYKEKEVEEGARLVLDSYLQMYLKNQRRENIPAPTDEALHEYYNTHKREFMIPPRYEGIEILTNGSAKARKLKKQILDGADMEQLATENTERVSGKKNKGHLGPISRNTYGSLGKALEGSKVGDLVGPVEINDQYSIFKVTKVYEEELQPFDKVAVKIATRLNNKAAKDDLDAYLEELRSKADIKVHRKNLKYVTK